jgi:hypothetical protein
MTHEMRKLMESVDTLTESVGNFVLLRVEAGDQQGFARYTPMSRENSFEHAIMHYAWNYAGYDKHPMDDAEEFVKTELAGKVVYQDGLAIIDMNDRVGEYWYVMSFGG